MAQESKTKKNPPLVLVDGSSYLFRAFYALPELTTTKGQPTGAVRGVIAMIRKLAKDYAGSTIAVVFDAPGKTYRRRPRPCSAGSSCSFRWPTSSISRPSARAPRRSSSASKKTSCAASRSSPTSASWRVRPRRWWPRSRPAWPICATRTHDSANSAGSSAAAESHARAAASARDGEHGAGAEYLTKSVG